MTAVNGHSDRRGHGGVRGVDPAGLGRAGTTRSTSGARGRGREAATATRGANALALDPLLDDAPTTYPRGADAAGAAALGRRRAGRAAVPVETDAGSRPVIGVAPPAPVSTPRAPFVSLVLVVVIVGVLGILVINTKINENAFHLHDLRKNQTNLDRDEERLLGEIAELESPNSLALAARRLGLVRADTPAYLRLPDGRVLGVPQPATAPSAGGTASPSGGGRSAGQPGG